MKYKIVEREDGQSILQLEDFLMDDMKIDNMNVRIRGLFTGNPIMSNKNYMTDPLVLYAFRYIITYLYAVILHVHRWLSTLLCKQLRGPNL